jgi:hypothetical protein
MIKSLVGIELQIDRPRIDGGKCIPHVFHFNSTSTRLGISDCFMGALACTIVVSSNDALSTDLHELVPRVIPITYVTCVTLFLIDTGLYFAYLMTSVLSRSSSSLLVIVYPRFVYVHQSMTCRVPFWQPRL